MGMQARLQNQGGMQYLQDLEAQLRGARPECPVHRTNVFWGTETSHQFPRIKELAANVGVNVVNLGVAADEADMMRKLELAAHLGLRLEMENSTCSVPALEQLLSSAGRRRVTQAVTQLASKLKFQEPESM